MHIDNVAQTPIAAVATIWLQICMGFGEGLVGDDDRDFAPFASEQEILKRASTKLGKSDRASASVQPEEAQPLAELQTDSDAETGRAPAKAK